MNNDKKGQLDLKGRNLSKIQKGLIGGVNLFLNLQYGGVLNSLLTIHKVNENNEKIKFRYNNTYNVYGIYYKNFLFLYYNDHRNVRRTKEIDRVLKILNKKDDAFELKYQEFFDLKLKQYFDNNELIQKIKQEIERFILSVYGKDEEYFKMKLKEFQSNQNLNTTTITTGIGKNNNDDGLLYLDKNGVTVKAKKEAKPGEYYYFKGEKYYIAKDKNDIQNKIFKEGFDAGKIVTTYVTDFSEMFLEKRRFNLDISSWDTSNVTTMRSFLDGCYVFNQNIFEYYDTSKVTDMSRMLYCCTKFNFPLTNLDTSNVTNFREMLFGCKSFQHGISHLNVEKGEDFGKMLFIETFNKSIKGWKPYSAIDVREMFYGKCSDDIVNEATEIFKKYSKKLDKENLNQIKSESYYL